MSVGIDIGSKTIKIIELKFESGKPVLKSAGAVGVKNANVEHLQTDAEFADLAATIKKLFQDAKVSSKDVCIALPESQVFTRIIKLPPLTDPEVESAVKWQAEDILPIPVKDAIFQHTVIERKENSQPPEIVVLVVAAPRLLVDKYIKLLTLAGLNVVGVETELLALTRSLGVPNQTVLLVNLGAKSTDIAIAKSSKLVFSRTISTGGDAFTRAVSQSLSIDPNQAEQYKKTYGLSSDQLEGKVQAAILPIFKIVVEEIKKSVHFYQNDEKGELPNLVILSGGSAGLPSISPVLTKLLGIEVVIANPFSRVSINPGSEKNLKDYAPIYSVAVGLALKE